jgi:hypothetical protein
MSKRVPPWDDTTAWRQLLRATVQPEARRKLVRDRALAAGAVEAQDGALVLPAGLEGAAVTSLKAQAGMVGLELRDALVAAAETSVPTGLPGEAWLRRVEAMVGRRASG